MVPIVDMERNLSTCHFLFLLVGGMETRGPRGSEAGLFRAFPQNPILHVKQGLWNIQGSYVRK